MTLFVMFPRCDAPGSAPGAAELAYQLRGAPVFDYLVGVVSVPKQNSCVMAHPTRFAASHVVYADLGLLVDNPSIRENLVKLGIPYIVDVHLPFGRHRFIQAIQPGLNDKTRNPDQDRDAADLWTSPEQIAKSIDVFADAAAVTSPRKDWAEMVRLYVPGRERTFVLPDVINPQSGGDFFRELCRITRRIKRARWRIDLILSARRGAATVRERLAAESDVDWAARGGGVR
jgi:hypothetical protein